MKRLFLALAVLAFAGGARAEDHFNPIVTGTPNTSGAMGATIIDPDGFINSQVVSKGLTLQVQDHANVIFTMKPGACLLGPLTIYGLGTETKFQLSVGHDYPTGCSKEQHAETHITNPSSAKLLPRAADPPDSNK